MKWAGQGVSQGWGHTLKTRIKGGSLYGVLDAAQPIEGQENLAAFRADGSSQRGWCCQLHGMLGDPLGRGPQGAGQATLKQGTPEGQLRADALAQRRVTHGTSQAGPRGHPGRPCGHLGNIHAQRKQRARRLRVQPLLPEKKAKGPSPQPERGAPPRSQRKLEK